MTLAQHKLLISTTRCLCWHANKVSLVFIVFLDKASLLLSMTVIASAVVQAHRVLSACIDGSNMILVIWSLAMHMC